MRDGASQVHYPAATRRWSGGTHSQFFFSLSGSTRSDFPQDSIKLCSGGLSRIDKGMENIGLSRDGEQGTKPGSQLKVSLDERLAKKGTARRLRELRGWVLKLEWLRKESAFDYQIRIPCLHVRNLCPTITTLCLQKPGSEMRNIFGNHKSSTRSLIPALDFRSFAMKLSSQSQALSLVNYSGRSPQASSRKALLVMDSQKLLRSFLLGRKKKTPTLTFGKTGNPERASRKTVSGKTQRIASPSLNAEARAQTTD